MKAEYSRNTRLFLLQAPLFAIAAVLVIVKLHVDQSTTTTKRSTLAQLRQIDFWGIALLGTSIVAVTGLLDQGGKSFPWRSWVTLVAGGGGLLLLIAFILVEAYFAKDPIFNLHILRRPNVAASYVIGTLQITAQLGMMFSIPLYFQVTQRASVTVAGGHLVPAVIGNTVGGLFAGGFIRRTGQYKILLVVASLVASISYVLLYFRWNGNTGLWESLYIIPGGLGTGIASASAFVAMTASLPAEEIAMATSVYMLLVSFAMTAGVTITNSVLGLEFQQQLRRNLHGPGSETVGYLTWPITEQMLTVRQIIKRATADTDYIAHLTGRLRDIVVNCYLSGLNHTYRKLFARTTGVVAGLLTYSSCVSRVLSRCRILRLVHSTPPLIDRSM